MPETKPMLFLSSSSSRPTLFCCFLPIPGETQKLRYQNERPFQLGSAVHPQQWDAEYWVVASGEMDDHDEYAAGKDQEKIGMTVINRKKIKNFGAFNLSWVSRNSRFAGGHYLQELAVALCFSFFIFLSSVFLHFPMCRQNLNRWLPFVFVYMQPMAVGNGFLNFLDKSARGRCRYVEWKQSDVSWFDGEVVSGNSPQAFEPRPRTISDSISQFPSVSARFLPVWSVPYTSCLSGVFFTGSDHSPLFLSNFYSHET